MPLICQEHAVTEQTSQHFANVLREAPATLEKLTQWPTKWRLYEAIFNERPVAFLAISPIDDEWKIEEFIVHPATRGRGVDSQLLQYVAKNTPTLKWAAELQPLIDRPSMR